MISHTFPKSHPRAGEQTNFVEKILNGEKIHTIRVNYDLWKKRIEEVNKGEAVISLRFWKGKPYRSEQIEFKKLTADSGCGIERMNMYRSNEHHIVYNINSKNLALLIDIARNDGLALYDFRKWFFPQWKGREYSYNAVIIHFTRFRYDSKRVF